MRHSKLEGVEFRSFSYELHRFTASPSAGALTLISIFQLSMSDNIPFISPIVRRGYDSNVRNYSVVTQKGAIVQPMRPLLVKLSYSDPALHQNPHHFLLV